MMKTVKWGVLGCASIADSCTLPAILEAPNAILFALAGRSKDKLTAFADKFKPQVTYMDYDALLDDQNVDAVYIPVPNALHREWVLKAVAKKKHVLCEKPLGLTAAEVEIMYDAAEANGVILMEAFANRHSPLLKLTKELVDQGVIGAPQFIESHLAYHLDYASSTKANKSLGGGAFYDISCYNTNFINYIVGEDPNSVHAVAAFSEEFSIDERNCIMLTYPCGVMAVSYCSLNCLGRGEYTILGSNGMLHVPYQFNSSGDTTIFVKNASGMTEYKAYCRNNYTLEFEQFGRCLLEGEKPLLGREDAVRNAKTLDAAMTSVGAR